MKAWRFTITSDMDGNAGTFYAPTKDEAELMIVEKLAKKGDSASCPEPVTIPTDKKGLIRWLNIWASHPDNG